MATNLTENGKIILESALTGVARKMSLFGSETRRSVTNQSLTENISWTTPSITSTGVDITNLATFFLPCTSAADVPNGELYVPLKTVTGIYLLDDNGNDLVLYDLPTNVTFTESADGVYGKYSVSSFEIQFVL